MSVCFGEIISTCEGHLLIYLLQFECRCSFDFWVQENLTLKQQEISVQEVIYIDLKAIQKLQNRSDWKQVFFFFKCSWK